MAVSTATKLAKISFITDDSDPFERWQMCVDTQKYWKEQLSSNEVITSAMDNYTKERAINFVWLSNELEGTLPERCITQHKAHEVLAKVYDGFRGDKDNKRVHLNNLKNATPAIRQLSQHLLAYKRLCIDSSPKEILSEDMIKEIHKIMMQGLKSDSGDAIHAGEYRHIAVHAGKHIFPAYECVPKHMARIVEEYNEKASKVHDPFQLASWLHYSVVSLHPFEDGNGRLSRLLSCYSLMRDGLPFAVTQTSGHKRSQKHLVWCLEQDRRPMVTGQPHLTTLTVISVAKAWDNFFTNFDLEEPTLSYILAV